MENTDKTSNTQEPSDVFADTVPTNVAGTSGLRIHFPSSIDATAIRPSRQYPEHLQKSYGMNFAPPVRRGSPLNPQKSSQRRTVQPNVQPLDSPALRHRRMPSPGLMDAGALSPESEADISLFSNEYDLSHEDPRILQDVQRAIKLKARREARLKRQQQSPSLSSPGDSPASAPSGPSSPLNASQSSWNQHSLRLPSPPASPTPARKTSGHSAASDIDFSPSTGLHIPIHGHPVPTSVDNGTTLDWTGTVLNDEKDRRWLHLGKKKEKDRILPLGVVAEQQDAVYKEKLNKIQLLASQQTLRKAKITKEQLSRRYKLIQDSQTSSGEDFNFLDVARWYAPLNDFVKRTMEKTEPFSWLRHLEGAGRKANRSQWHLTALMMEEYMQASSRARRVPAVSQSNFSTETIPDEVTTLNAGASQEDSELLSPTHETISFGPHHRSHVDSLDSRVRDAMDSGSSFRFPIPSASVSPSPYEPRGISRPYLQSNAKSDRSSIVDSLSDISDSGAVKRPPTTANKSPRPPPVELDIPLVVEPQGEPTAIPLELKVSTSSKGSDPSVNSKGPTGHIVQPTKKNPLPRRIWTSLPSSETVKPFVEDDELRLRREYEVKLRILEESNKQNHRIRQMLNRISAAVREYDSVQNSGSKKTGVPYQPLPKELLDAFSHDPAAVTGPTRRLRGWRAVEDIHQRVLRQREVFQAFLSNPSCSSTASESILNGPAESLMETLEALEVHRSNITAMATEITESLQQVQHRHSDVKEEYNMTMSRTSVLYPELSNIVALEESYRDRYQGFYDFGMDALTLLLDTVTPLWRTHGKTIGEDVRDFLIIPLYRNEFTGEAKRYPVKGLPCRPPRHWLGLVVFFFVSICVMFLQLRTAVTSIFHYRLQWIPYEGVRWTALPLFWIGILIQWLAVIVEMVVVVMQLGTIVWWAGWFVKIFH